ncbi:MAG: DUF262 domain-containing protein, partial [Fimbriimonadaceae bacterium]
ATRGRMTDYSIREVVDHILGGRVRIPAFQRGFVWDSDLVAYLMDSLYRGYPFGSVLLWRTRQQLRTERALGPFELPARDPEYPIDYVLDGQQRLTSIFGVFQTELPQPPPELWTPIYFDLLAEPAAQESQFVALVDGEVDTARHFPLATLFDSVAYRAATKDLNPETAKKIDDMQAQFKEVKVPIASFETENRARVAIVFERVNRLGVELDTFQLISAWTWSEDFDLQDRFKTLAEQLEDYGFRDVGDDTNLLLRCCAAVVSQDVSPDAIISLNGAEVRERFDEIEVGIQGAIDFLRANLNVHSLSNLPYSTLLIPLTVFFAAKPNQGVNVSNDQRIAMERWFWRSCFSRRFSSGVLRSLKTDIDAMIDLRDGKEKRLGDFAVALEDSFFLNERFLRGSVNTDTFVLMLAQSKPRTWISGQPVGLGDVLRHYNRNQFHHIYPKQFLGTKHEPDGRINSLVNFAFLSAQDNKVLGGEAPSRYRAKMSGDVSLILESSIVPPAEWIADEYEAFRTKRAEMLAEVARTLMGTAVVA